MGESERERGREVIERERLAGSPLGYTVKRDEPPFPLGGRAGSLATIFKIYRSPKGARKVLVKEIILMHIAISPSRRSIAPSLHAS